MSVFVSTQPRLAVTLGEGGQPFEIGLPVLAGEPVEQIFPHARPVGRRGALTLFQAGMWLLGAAKVDIRPGLEHAARQLYGDILDASRQLHLARIWNYVPDINAAGPAGLENYRAFCRGRSLAFEAHFGASFRQQLPAASAVGCHDGALTVIFAATPQAPRHLENPLQVPAYDYPPEHGPRPPSFARATVVPAPAGPTVFISGTAAIRGHATIAPGDLAHQLDCTLENLREISRACGLGPDLAAGPRRTRHFKVYLRHPADLAATAAFLHEHLLRPDDRVCYVQADICRASLCVEIEATLIPG
ncbi:MAG: hypothetical protein JSS11_01385 [Verrucomicrobia bacterium]|nr:hypothetical protein [Verrucomicrobiota bacterium]